MRYDQARIVIDGDMSSDISSSGIDLQQIAVGAVQAVWTGNPTGNFTIEVSNDIAFPGTQANPSAGVVNWTTYTGSTVSAGGADGNWVWAIANIGYRWIRLKYTAVSGSGELNSIWCGKGV